MSRPKFPRDEETTPLDYPYRAPCPRDPIVPREYRSTWRAAAGRVARHPVSWSVVAVAVLELALQMLARAPLPPAPTVPPACEAFPE